jgi:predicted enzyme related to lactoylglutathione lyase
LDAGNIILGLHPEGDEVKVSPTTGMSIGIYVDDMDKAVAEIRGRYGKIAVGPRSDPFGRWALVFDPDGYCIQIIEMARGLRVQHKLPPEPSAD